MENERIAEKIEEIESVVCELLRGIKISDEYYSSKKYHVLLVQKLKVIQFILQI